jgi:Lanthionine-containing peptide SapB precursor RamS
MSGLYAPVHRCTEAGTAVPLINIVWTGQLMQSIAIMRGKDVDMALLDLQGMDPMASVDFIGPSNLSVAVCPTTSCLSVNCFFGPDADER